MILILFRINKEIIKEEVSEETIKSWKCKNLCLFSNAPYKNIYDHFFQKPEPEIQNEEDLELESIAMSSGIKLSKGESRSKSKSIIPSEYSMSKTNDKLDKTVDLSNTSFQKISKLPMNETYKNKSMGNTTLASTMNQLPNQSMKIKISKDVAAKAKEDREKQIQLEKAKKPEIYYKAQAELRYLHLLTPCIANRSKERNF